MTDIQRIEAGPRMSQAVVHNGVVYVAGQVASGARGGSCAEQTQDILKRIDALLAAAGTDKSKLLSSRVWLTDMRGYDEMNSVWDKWVPAGQAPTRMCLAAKLASPDYAVEIAVVAAK